VVAKSVQKVLGLAVATTWEKRDPLTSVKRKGRLQLHVCESVVFVSGGKVHPCAGVIILQVGEPH
jgi:hypothetical protein